MYIVIIYSFVTTQASERHIDYSIKLRKWWEYKIEKWL